MGQKIDLTQQVQGILPEANGGAGPNIGLRFSDAETPSGATNGANTSFSLAHAPNPALSLLLFLTKTAGGTPLLQIPGTDFTLAGSTITMTVAPPGTTASFLAWYRYLGFGQTLSFSDGLSMVDAFVFLAFASPLQTGLVDQMTTLSDLLLLEMGPSYFTDLLVMVDVFVFGGVGFDTLAFTDSMTLSDAYVSNMLPLKDSMTLSDSISKNLAKILLPVDQMVEVESILKDLTPVFYEFGDNLYLLDLYQQNMAVVILKTFAEQIPAEKDGFLFQMPPNLMQFLDTMTLQESVVIGYGFPFLDFLEVFDTTDPFNAALSGAWTQVSGTMAYDGTTGLKTATVVGGFAAMQRNDVSFGAEQHAQVQVAVLNGFNCRIGPTINMPAGVDSGYQFYGSAGSFFLDRIDTGVPTNIASAAGTSAVNDVLRIENDGVGNITCKKNGTVVITFHDAKYGAGTVGVCGTGIESSRVVNFAGGPGAGQPHGADAVVETLQ